MKKSFTIKELPKVERPREKFILHLYRPFYISKLKVQEGPQDLKYED